MMFKIGDFSRISQVSIKTLHHYDEVGLLKPAHVDEESSYRYYVLEQLPRLNRILALKDLGFSLEQIASILAENISSVEISGMLRLKRAELQQRVDQEQARLNRVETRLRQILNEDALPTYEIILKSLPSQLIASASDVVPASNDVSERCRVLGITLYETLEQVGIKIAGPMSTIYHDLEEYTGQDQDISVEMALVVERAALAKPLPVESKVIVRELPAVKLAACLIHTGAYEGLWQAYGAMINWVEENGYYRNGPFRFVYLRHSEQVTEPIIEMQFPVGKAHQA